jgi:hypothetical protein
MKQKDVALIIVVAAISGVLSFVVSHFVFSSPSNRTQTAEVVDAINNQFTTPSSKYFNANSIDPAQAVTVGNSNNTDPFNGTSQ